jgi:phosphatidylserine decarboxylase
MATLSFGERVLRSAWRMTPQRKLSDIIGWGARCPLPTSVRTSFLRSFANKYGIDVSEAEKPIEEYHGLHEFFTRKLRAGVRQVNEAPDVVVSPADGMLVDQGIASGGRLLEAKGSMFTLSDLLGEDDAAAALVGGAYVITYLSPRDYHRVHSPVSGKVSRWHYIPGKLFPVNDRSVRREPGLFAKNERFVTLIESEAGLCAVVMVAAVGVGHITASYDPDVATHSHAFGGREARHKRFETRPEVRRGDELGVFNLGSTTIVIFEPGRVVLESAAVGVPTRMGTALGRIVRRD